METKRRYQSVSKMEEGINKKIADGWIVEDTEFIPEKKTIPAKTLIYFFIGLGRRTVESEYYLVTYSKESSSQSKNWKDFIYTIPRWLLYGMFTATAFLIAFGLAVIIDDDFANFFLIFGLLGPVLVMDLLFSQQSLSNSIYIILMPPVFWFVIGAVIGKVISLPRYDSISGQNKFYISVVIVFGIFVIGFIAAFMIGYRGPI